MRQLKRRSAVWDFCGIQYADNYPHYTYIKEILGLAKGKIILNLSLMVILGALEGIGILLLIPLLHLAGIGEMSQITLGAGFTLRDIFKSMAPALSLLVVLLIYVGVIILQSGLNRYQSNLSVTIQQSLQSYLSVKIFQGLTYAKWPFLAAKKKSDLTAIFTSELTRVSVGIHFLFQLIATAILALVQTLIAFLISPVLTLLVIGGGLVFYIFTRKHVEQAKKMGSALSEHNRDLYSSVTEHLEGIKEVKSWGMEEMHIGNFREIRKAIENNFVDFNRVQSGTRMLYKVGAAAFISIFFYITVSFFQTPPQEILIIIVIFARLWPRFSSFQGGLHNVSMMLPIFYEVINFAEQCHEEKEIYFKGQAAGPLNLQGQIEFKHVFYSYDPVNSIYAVKDLSFIIPAGKTTALTGVSGAGKSTIADLITGMLTPQKGKILIDGVSMDSVDVHLWRESIAYVPQDAFLFNAPIRDNLLWGYPKATEEEIWQVLRLAAIDEFVSGLPEGLDTIVGDRGVRLSGGEKQRIVLARALLRKPSLLILDESTSALDQENESRILQAIVDLLGRLSILIIAHRFSTIKGADQIIVLEQGKVVETGLYQNLVSKNESRLHSLMSV